MKNKDIVKGLIYYRGEKTLNGQTKHFSLVTMVIASDKPLADKDNQEIVIMGSAHLSEEISRIQKYQKPYHLGDISGAIQLISKLPPDELEVLGSP